MKYCNKCGWSDLSPGSHDPDNCPWPRWEVPQQDSLFTISIGRASNGYIIKYPSDAGEVNVVEVCEQPEDEHECEYEALTNMLWIVSEIFGGYKSKHHQHAVRIDCKCKTEKGLNDEDN